MALNKLNLFSIVIVFLVCTPLAAKSVLFKSANILDIKAGKFIKKQDVLVRDGKIVQIGKITTSKKVMIIEADNKYLVPGFTEMHAHVHPSQVSDAERDRLLFLFNAFGITTIRGMLGHSYHLKMRKQLENNEIAGSRLITSGPSFNGSTISSPEQAVKRAKTQFEKGYDFIKVHPGMSDAEYQAMVKQANQLKFDFSGHVTAETGILKSVELGQGTIEHLDGVLEELSRRSGNQNFSKTGFFGYGLTETIDNNLIQPLAKELAESKIYLVPTQSFIANYVSPENPAAIAQKPQYKLMPDSVIDNWKSSKKRFQNNKNYSKDKVDKFMSIRLAFLREYIKAGGKVLSGSDAPQVFNVPGDSLHDEMEWMHTAGMSPIEIFRSTTIEPAKYFKRADEFGSIELGKSADLVLLNANPLKDISNTREIEGVMTRGIWLSKTDIEKKLTELRLK